MGHVFYLINTLLCRASLAAGPARWAEFPGSRLTPKSSMAGSFRLLALLPTLVFCSCRIPISATPLHFSDQPSCTSRLAMVGFLGLVITEALKGEAFIIF